MPKLQFLRQLLIAVVLCLPMAATAQMQVAFGSLERDENAPVEVSADSLSVSQEENLAVFTGNVVISQGGMNMKAPKVTIYYNEDTQGASRMLATGGVLMTSQEDAAQSDEADYDIETGLIEMKGNVLLTQGVNTLTSDSMTVDLNDNSAQMHGRVKTVFRNEETSD